MKIYKNIVRFYSLALLGTAALPFTARAQVSIDFPTNFAGFSSQDLKVTVQNIIRIILGFLGILAIVAVIFGGFKMMISRGDADEMGSGRKVVTAGVIGLVIVLAAYAISSFVVASIQTAV